MPQTLEEAKQALRDTIDTGAYCPCCNHWVQRYDRTMNANQARWLITLVHIHRKTQSWVHIREIAAALKDTGGCSDFPQVRHWGLIVRPPSDDGAKKESGLWIPTTDGVRFARGELEVPSHIRVYNNELLRVLPKRGHITIHQALRKQFSYADVMAGLE